MTRTGVGLALAVVLMATPSGAQRRRTPRVIQLELHHENYRPPPPLVMYVGASDSCPGATLTRLCGGTAPPAGTCPELSAALGTVGALASCRADPDLVPVAIALNDGAGPDDLRASQTLFEILERLPRFRALAIVAQMTTGQRLGAFAAPPHAMMARLMALPRLSADIRRAAIEIFAHSLVEPDGDGDGVDDLAPDETVISPTRLPNMSGAADMAWRALELLMDTARYQDVQRALDVFQVRWPAERIRERDDMRAQAFRHNRQFNEMLIHLRASAIRCEVSACRTHFRELLRSSLVERLHACRRSPAERPLVRRCLRDALEIEELLTPDAPASVRADAASTMQWAMGELAQATRSAAPAMETPRAAADETSWGGDIDRRGVWRPIARSVQSLRRCGPRRGDAIRVRLRVAVNGAVSVDEASRARRCLQRALRDLRGPRPEGGVAFVRGTFVFAPR